MPQYSCALMGQISGNILSIFMGLPEVKKSPFLLHNRSFMPGIYISILKDQTFPIHVFPFKGLLMYGRH